MASYLDRLQSKSEIVSYIGDPSQIAGAIPFVLSDGKANGVKAIQVETGGGLQFLVLPGRGMDIARATYRGVSLNFLSPTSITSPKYFEEPGLGFLRGFFAGLLTTCGLTNMGAPSRDEDIDFGLHGRISNTEAEDVCINREWCGDDYIITVKGVVREVKAMGENLVMTRTIATRLGAKGFTLTDNIENRGFRDEPLLVLYHFNFGYPLLGASAKIVGSVSAVDPRDEEAAADNGTADAFSIPAPIIDIKEKVFWLTPKPDPHGNAFIALINRQAVPDHPLAAVLRFNTTELPFLTEWKMPRKGFYALGLEPSTAKPIGRKALRENGGMTMIGAQESYSIHIDFSVLDNNEDIDRLEREAEQ